MNLSTLIGGLIASFFLVYMYKALAEKCQDTIEVHLGSKTPYRLVANKTYGKDNNFQGCVKKIWMLIRHGTRYPSAEDIRDINTHLPLWKHIILEKNSNVYKSKLIKSDIELFKYWQPTFDERDEKKITIEGEQEMLELAERMQARFPDILPPIYSDTWYRFRFTKTQRTRGSAQSFAIGLFDKATVKDIYFPQPVKDDPVLRFYKSCSKWRVNVKQNNATYVQRKQFENSDSSKMALTKISDKLGLDDTLSFDDAYLMYTTCAFETAMFINRKSPWCVPFDLDTIRVMEYAQDLKYFWVDGYGSEITYKQACTTFNDMFNFLIDENPYPKASFYFSHSGTILKLLAHFGLYNDTYLLNAKDYFRNDNRKWRVSKIDSFGSNLALILHECNYSKKILVLHNESPVELPACPGNYLCNLDRVRQFYFKSINGCEFDSICENDILYN